jgi:hypothetical protein
MAVANFAYSVLKVPGPHGPIIIYGDQKGVVAYDMKTLDLIKQFKQVLADPAEPPSKQQKSSGYHDNASSNSTYACYDNAAS